MCMKKADPDVSVCISNLYGRLGQCVSSCVGTVEEGIGRHSAGFHRAHGTGRFGWIVGPPAEESGEELKNPKKSKAGMAEM